jgi:hypothetical protein
MRRALTLALPALLLAEAAAAQVAPRSATPRAQAEAALIYPLTVIVKSNLDFGYLAVTTGGTAVIDPNSGALSTTGGVTALGGQPRPATFIGAARSATVVNLKLPNQPVTLTRVGGTETMQLRSFTLQGQDKRALARMTSFEFNVGGTLVVAANQVDGLYSGTFDITVQYP